MKAARPVIASNGVGRIAQHIRNGKRGKEREDGEYRIFRVAVIFRTERELNYFHYIDVHHYMTNYIHANIGEISITYYYFRN